MALLMGRSVLLALTLPKWIPFPYEESPTIGHIKPVVIFAASFNPPHLGHLDLLKHLSLTADKVPPGPFQSRFATALPVIYDRRRVDTIPAQTVTLPHANPPTQLG
jgi:hypothetical protein